MGNIIIGGFIAIILVGIVVKMIRNVRHGRSFCGADLPEPLNTTDNLKRKQ